MGHDYATFKNKSVHLRDADLWVLRHFLIEAVRQSNSDVELDSFFRSWAWQGVGVFSEADFEKYVQGVPEKLSQVLKVLRLVGTLLEAHGEYISEDYLTRSAPSSMIRYTGPWKTLDLKMGLDRMVALLTESNAQDA